MMIRLLRTGSGMHFEVLHSFAKYGRRHKIVWAYSTLSRCSVRRIYSLRPVVGWTYSVGFMGTLEETIRTVDRGDLRDILQ